MEIPAVSSLSKEIITNDRGGVGFNILRAGFSSVERISRRKTVTISLVLIIATPLILTLIQYTHPRFEVGIVLVDNIDDYYGDVVREGYEHYDEYFSATVLPFRFTTEEVRNNGPYFLNSDFFRNGDPKKIQRDYGVDIVLFVTNHQINNWDEGGGGYSGEANPQTRSALMTIYDFNGGGPENERVIKHIALHETFHLFGYTHNTQDRSGIMQYDTNIGVVDLVPFYEIQMPSRSLGFQLFPYMKFGNARLAYQGIFALAVLPSAVGISMLTLKGYESIFENRRKLRGLIITIPMLVTIALEMAESYRFFIGVSLLVLLIPGAYRAGEIIFERIRSRTSFRSTRRGI